MGFSSLDNDCFACQFYHDPGVAVRRSLQIVLLTLKKTSANMCAIMHSLTMCFVKLEYHLPL